MMHTKLSEVYRRHFDLHITDCGNDSTSNAIFSKCTFSAERLCYHLNLSGDTQLFSTTLLDPQVFRVMVKSGTYRRSEMLKPGGYWDKVVYEAPKDQHHVEEEEKVTTEGL